MTATQQGFLFIADITGYSTYLNQSELEHARDSLTDLLNLLIEHTRPPLTISKLEGDAVFSYAPDGAYLQGQTLVETVEIIYLAFRRARQLMVLNTTCRCNACQNIPNLDLKFFIHFGTFSTQELGAFHELVGNDVNIVHRIGKNSIKATFGLGAYAAYTDAVVDHLGMHAITEPWHTHRETFADVGEVTLQVQDLHAVWEARKDEVRTVVTPEEAFSTHAAEFSVPPLVLWGYITRPEYRKLLNHSDSQQIEMQRLGRTGPDTVYRCAHGRAESVHTVLDWEPFQQYTTRETNPIVNAVNYDVTYRIKEAPGGSILSQTYGPPRGPLFQRTLIAMMVRTVFARMPQLAFDHLREAIQQDINDGVVRPAAPVDSPHADGIAAAVTESLKEVPTST